MSIFNPCLTIYTHKYYDSRDANISETNIKFQRTLIKDLKKRQKDRYEYERILIYTLQ